MSALEENFTHHITLLRHGESRGNTQNVFQGHAEYDLTERGHAQSQALAAYWLDGGHKFNHVISSPQSRARQTAEIIAKTLSIPLEFDPNWKEINNGNLSGLSLEEIGQSDMIPEFMTPYEPIGESGESNWDLYLRAGQAVQDLINRPAGDYLVVSHGGFLTRVMYVILGIFPQANFTGARFRFHNTAYAVVQYDPGRHIWMIDRLNERSHLTGSNG